MIRLRVLGSLELCKDDGRELRSVLVQPKRAALLAYLASAAPAGFHRRDRLLALFWPEQSDAQARGALNAAVHFLRREIGRGAIVSRGGDEIGIDPSVCWTDAAAFREALDAGRHAEALALYRADLLDGLFVDVGAPFEEWLDRARSQWRASAARAARALAEQREHEENFTTAVSCARRAVALSEGDERVLRQLLEMLERLGDRAGAVLAYEQFERRLATDLETVPAAETRELIERIRTREATTLARRPVTTTFEPSLGRLNGWVVERELGRGGMSTVYLARDTAHDRHVALKIMRPELVLTSGVEAFLREIQITARLAHPHILPMIDSGRRDGVPYLVTPFVAGESLRARLTREKTIPVGDALRLATEIAEALDYAHRSGVVHRDIKPENILLADGHAVVADFGVSGALAMSGSRPVSDGAIVGSKRYMSPEQAIGAADADARVDIYALGCVLHEMICGEVPSEGDSARLANLPQIPKPVRRLVSDCLAADPERRPPTAAHVLRRLEELQAEESAPARRAVQRSMRILIAGAAMVGVSGVVWTASVRARGWASVTMGATTQITNIAGLELDPALSPDGKAVAYVGGAFGHMRIYVRAIAGGNAVEVSGNEMSYHRWPTWSPDGNRLAFLASSGDRADGSGQLIVVPTIGGPQRVIADRLMYYSTPAWSPDGRFIAYPLNDSIVVHDATSGASRSIPVRARTRGNAAAFRSGSAWSVHSLSWSPNGRRLAFVSGNAASVFGTTSFGNLGPTSIWTTSVDGGEPTRLTTGPYTFASPVWTPDSREILYVSNADGASDVYNQSIDAGGRPTAAPKRLTTGVNAHGISLARDGKRLAYTVMNTRSNIFAVPIKASVATWLSEVRAVTDANQTIETVDVTSDGRWLAFESNRTGRTHIYKMSLVTGELVQLTSDPMDDFAPRWSPDGKRIAFHRREISKDGLRHVYVMDADGARRTRISTDSLDDSYPQWSPDGQRIIFGNLGRNMVVQLGHDGRWSEPTPDSTPRIWAQAGRFRVYNERDSMYSRDADGGPPHLLANGRALGGRLMAARIGADPATVYFRVLDTAGVHSFYAVPVGGGAAPRLVVRLDKSLRGPARILFSTDSRHLYFTLTKAESDIWTVELRR